MALYHTVQGSVNYTVVGSPTIVDGVVSGLDNGRLTIDNFPFASSNWEIGIKVGFNYVQNVQRLLTSSAKFYLRASYSTWQLITDGETVQRIGDEGDARNYPFVKLVKNGSYISAYLSTDGITYKSGLENYSAGDATDGTLNISAQYSPWTGSIDLNSTYIKVNGAAWFGKCPVEVKKVVRHGESSVDVNYVVKDGKLVWADPRIYLQSSGTQYIDTGLSPQQSTAFELVAAKLGTFSDDNMFGSRKSSGPTTDLLGILTYSESSTNFISICTAGIQYAARHITYDNNFHIYIANNTSVSIDNNTYSHTAGSYDTNDLPIYLFGLNNRGTAQLSSQKVRYLKLFNNDTIIRHFVPVPTGLVIGNFTVPSNGMFDIINQQFYANQGTGEFTIGRDE